MINRDRFAHLVKSEKVHQVDDTACMVATLVLNSGYVVVGVSQRVRGDGFNSALNMDLALENAYNRLAKHEAYRVADTNECLSYALDRAPYPDRPDCDVYPSPSCDKNDDDEEETHSHMYWSFGIDRD